MKIKKIVCTALASVIVFGSTKTALASETSTSTYNQVSQVEQVNDLAITPFAYVGNQVFTTQTVAPGGTATGIAMVPGDGYFDFKIFTDIVCADGDYEITAYYMNGTQLVFDYWQRGWSGVYTWNIINSFKGGAATYIIIIENKSNKTISFVSNTLTQM